MAKATGIKAVKEYFTREDVGNVAYEAMIGRQGGRKAPASSELMQFKKACSTDEEWKELCAQAEAAL